MGHTATAARRGILCVSLKQRRLATRIPRLPVPLSARPAAPPSSRGHLAGPTKASSQVKLSLMGRAERRKKTMRDRYRWVTAKQCQLVAAQIGSALDRFGLHLNPASDLAQMVREMEWLGSFDADPFSPGGAAEKSRGADKERFISAFLHLEQARRIADALTWAAKVANSETVVRWLRKRIDRIATQDEKSQDYLFELEIAARFASKGLTVSLEEPDIVVTLPNGFRFAFACKRPRHAGRVGPMVREAADQVTGSGLPGIAVIGVEALLHRSEDPTRKTVFYAASNPESARAEGERIVGEAIAEARKDISRAFEKGLGGILFCGIMTFTSQRPSAYAWNWIRQRVPNPSVAPAAKVLAVIDGLLFEP
jgi:hypothetical protein